MSDLNLSPWERKLYQERLINFTVYSQRVRMANKKKHQKKFEITCNKGSLEGPANNNIMMVMMSAVNIEAARAKFNVDEENQRYGRRIISIREV